MTDAGEELVARLADEYTRLITEAFDTGRITTVEEASAVRREIMGRLYSNLTARLALAEARAAAMVDGVLSNFWLDHFTTDGLCCLCGNTGMVDTRATAVTPAGIKTGDRRPCMCPNGRALISPEPDAGPIGHIKMPEATPDQVEYLEKIRNAPKPDPNTVIGGPRKAGPMNTEGK